MLFLQVSRCENTGS